MSSFCSLLFVFIMPHFVLRPWMRNLRLLIFAGVSYASIVTDSATFEISLRILGVVTRQPVTLTQPKC